MSKLNKDQIQKVVASALMLGVVLAGYYNLLLSPLKANIARMETEVVGVEEKVKEANTQIRKAQGLDEQVAQSQNTIDLLEEFMLDGAPEAWFPPLIQEFFTTHGVKSSPPRRIEFRGAQDPALRKYQSGIWSAQFSQIEFAQWGMAMSALENEQPLLRFTRIQVELSSDTPQFQRADVEIYNIIKQ